MDSLPLGPFRKDPGAKLLHVRGGGHQECVTVRIDPYPTPRTNRSKRKTIPLRLRTRIHPGGLQ